jgi:hypothetical protein
MEHKKIITESNKDIDIFDDAFSYVERLNYFRFAKGSRYMFDRLDDSMVHTTNNSPKPTCNFTLEDEMNFGLIDDLPNEIIQFLSGYQKEYSYINLSNIGVINNLHIDGAGGCKTLLYYINLEWDINHGGETFFYNDDTSEIIFTSMVKPGRIIIFDGSIPHNACSPNISSGATLRMTYAVKFRKKTNNSYRRNATLDI